MVPLGIERLLDWMLEEHRRAGSMFGIPEAAFEQIPPGEAELLGEPCDLPLGPAAGPHTQLAQNIVAAYLCGARYFELKTVQKLDRLEIAKPCIDARDEGYNTEWSQELSLEQAFGEYLAAWAALHALGAWRGGGGTSGVVFAMSVGYDLEGIRSAEMDRFIDRMVDACSEDAGERLYARCVEAISRLPSSAPTLPPRLSSSVTLSTMHGCPAREIEEICRHLMQRKRLTTLVKLNPTLLGMEDARSVLDSLGWKGIVPVAAAFEEDLRFGDAVAMIGRLAELGRSEGVGFGVKLSNTLGVVNDGRVLPGQQKYLSGRALAPLTLLAASRLAEAVGPGLRISYAGGASELNVRELLAAGLRPITVATELLKPGGYLRLRGMARAAREAIRDGLPAVIDAARLRRLADSTREAGIYAWNWRPRGTAKVRGSLPLFDCVRVPCAEACPVGQRVPEYIRALGAGREAEAAQIIGADNVLPGITSWICDRPCMERCSRIDYEGPVRIREMKKAAVSRAGAPSLRPAVFASGAESRVAVIGAGPSGLAAASYLARCGIPVTVFEKAARAGGVLSSVLPSYRLPGAVTEKDVAAARELGVELRLDTGSRFSIDELRGLGYRFVYVAVGAEVARPLRLFGGGRVIPVLEFLRAYNEAVLRGGAVTAERLGVGRRVAVIGGGNTAVDGARTARRLEGVEWVGIVYRRSGGEMPADREEFEAALAEGVEFLTLLAPESLEGGVLRCRRMVLGEPDADGRRVPLPSERYEPVRADTAVAAIGEGVDIELLRAAGLLLEDRGALVVDPATMETRLAGVFAGGDAVRGGGTVVESMADARRAAREIARRAGASWPEGPPPNRAGGAPAVDSRSRLVPASLDDLPDAVDHHGTRHADR